MGSPLVIAFHIIFFEFFGAISLIIGFASHFMAFGILVIMIGAITIVHYHNGYFLNWHNTKEGEGIQFNLLMIGICIGLITLGPGTNSIDCLINF